MSLGRPGSDAFTGDASADAAAAADPPSASGSLHVLLGGTVLTEDSFAAMPERARIEVEYTDGRG